MFYYLGNKIQECFVCCGVVSIVEGNNIWWLLAEVLDVVLNKFASFIDTENKGN